MLSSLLIALVALFTAFAFYLAIGRTELLRNKISKAFLSSTLVDGVSAKSLDSVYFSTLDADIKFGVSQGDSRFYLISGDTHGQLANNYYFVSEVQNRVRAPIGIYGSGRIPRVVRRYDKVATIYNKSSLKLPSILSELLQEAESIEVSDTKIYIFFRIGSVWGSEAIELVASKFNA